MIDVLSPSAHTYGFVLTPNFALMSYASATEPLRAANLIARTPLYEVVPLSIGGRAVVSSTAVHAAPRPT